MGMVKDLLRRIYGVGKPVVDPIHGVVRHEMENTRQSNDSLSSNKVALVAVASLAVVALTIMARLMYFSKYASMTTEEIQLLHPWVAAITLAASTLYIWAVYMKGVRYWLVYVPPIAAIVASLVFLALYNEWIMPEDMRLFDFGPDWWRGQ